MSCLLERADLIYRMEVMLYIGNRICVYVCFYCIQSRWNPSIVSINHGAFLDMTIASP